MTNFRKLRRIITIRQVKLPRLLIWVLPRKTNIDKVIAIDLSKLLLLGEAFTLRILTANNLDLIHNHRY